jgi:hypothetical protein
METRTLEESLKVCRLTHLFIILTSATMLLFALSAEPRTNEYKQARQELTTAIRTIREISDLRFETITQEYERNGVLKVLRDQWKGTQVVIEPSPGDEFLRTSSDLPRVKLEDLYTFFVETAPTYENDVWDVDLEALRDAMRHMEFSPSKQGGVLNVRFRQITNAPTYTTGLPSLQFDPNFKPGDRLLVISLNGKTIRFSVAATGRRSVSTDRPRQLAIDRKLLIQNESGVDALPALRFVWQTVGELDIGRAEYALQSKETEIEKNRDTQLSVFGLSVKAGNAVIAGPLILLALLLYLYAHLLHLKGLASGNEATLRTFPWLALFETRISIILTYVTLLLLPNLAVLYLVLVADLYYVAKIILAAAYVTAVFGLGIAILKNIRVPLHLLRGNPPASPPLPEI